MYLTILRMFISSQVLLFLAFGCHEEKNEDKKDEEIEIISELPVMYQGINLKQDEQVHITDQLGFDTIFSYELINQIQILQDIDFSKYDILVGADVFTHGIYQLEHHFYKILENQYKYKLFVQYEITLPAGGFFYGIVINKLPNGSTVKFEIQKSN